MSAGRVRLALVGAAGRMGRRLDALSEASPDLVVGARVDRDTPPLRALDAGSIDCVIDFSVRDHVAATCGWCAAYGVPLVLGTTGLLPADREALEAAAARAPIVSAPNFSVGVNVLFAVAGRLAELAGQGWDLEVVESHHRHKVDAPSGTARRVVEVLAEARGASYAEAARCGREGLVGPRADSEIGVSVVRGGDVVGEHTVLYLGQGERLELTHRATDRDIFARGALRAARWLVRGGGADRGPGLFAMSDVLG